MTPQHLTRAIVKGILGGLLVAGVGIAAISAQRPAEAHTYWTFETCATNDCIKRTLDRLPPDRAAEAKITTWRDTSYVWYRP